MNGDYILLQSIRILVLLLLFIVPLGYCIYKGSFKKGFWFTWVMWIVVVFIYGIFLPAIATLTAKVTGESVDYDGFGFILGLFIGWLPALGLALFGGFIHNLIIRK